MKSKTNNKPTFAVSALTLKVHATNKIAPSEVQLTPNGYFSANDGRPFEVPMQRWLINEEIAKSVIEVSLAKKNPIIIDYEHQTLLKEKNGQPAPAAARFSKLEWRDTGLWAIDVKWTTAATKMIIEHEYLFISPVLLYDQQTGHIAQVMMAALTNTAAVDGMKSLVELSDKLISTALNQLNQTNQEDSKMDLAKLIALLSLTENATEEDVLQALQALKEKATKDSTDLADLTAKLADLTSAGHSPDPAKFVPIEVVTGLKAEIAALTIQHNESNVEAVVDKAIKDKRISPVEKAWAISLGKSNMAALAEHIDLQTPLAVLAKAQVDPAKKQTESMTAALTTEQKAVAAAFGVTESEFKQTLKEFQGE